MPASVVSPTFTIDTIVGTLDFVLGTLAALLFAIGMFVRRRRSVESEARATRVKRGD